jgi:hypothetical protein
MQQQHEQVSMWFGFGCSGWGVGCLFFHSLGIVQVEVWLSRDAVVGKGS